MFIWTESWTLKLRALARVQKSQNNFWESVEALGYWDLWLWFMGILWAFRQFKVTKLTGGTEPDMNLIALLKPLKQTNFRHTTRWLIGIVKCHIWSYLSVYRDSTDSECLFKCHFWCVLQYCELRTGNSTQRGVNITQLPFWYFDNLKNESIRRIRSSWV